MKPTEHCSQCTRELSPTAPFGLCSQCLLQSFLEPTPEDESLAEPHPPTAETPHRFGDFELLEVIARGGMGVVYRAQQLSLHRFVALKMIRTGEFASDVERKRFQAEAEAAAHLDHPNIVPIYEIGEHEGQDYFAMKLIEGDSLAEQMRKAEGGAWITPSAQAAVLPLPGGEGRGEGGRSSQDESVFRIPHFIKVARAVHYAHQRGVLHRDLKPANILLDPNGEPFVADFGLAKRIETGLDLTLTGAVIGTPNYMSPEQAAGRSREITTAADIYSLGAILYELIAGRPPFQADTPLATMRRVLEEEPVPPYRVRKEVISHPSSVVRKSPAASRQKTFSRSPTPRPSPLARGSRIADRDLETICLKCLQKNPAQRYASASALAEDLERWLRHEPIQARPNGVWERGVRWARRKPALAALMILALIAPALIIAVLLRSGIEVRHERNLSREQAHVATNALARAEVSERAARERAYAADLYAASQALAVDDLAQARQLLNEQRPHGIAITESQTTNRADTLVRPSPLASHPAPDLRGFEWRALWERTRGQEAFAFTNLARPATCLVFAPDGRTLISGGDDGIHLWDLVERRPLGLFPGPDPGPPKGDHTPTAEDLRPLLEASPALVDYLKVQPGIFDYLDAFGHTQRTRNVTSLAFTPDGEHLLVGSGDLVRSWNFATRAFDFAIPEKNATVDTPRGGDFFVVANHQRDGLDDERRSAHPESALVYSLTRRRLVAELPGYGWHAIISPDGEYVAAASQTRGVVLWRFSTGEIVTISQEPHIGHLLAFDADGSTLFVASDFRRILWDVPSKQIRADLRTGLSFAKAVAWSPDGRFLITEGANQSIALLSVPLGPATNSLDDGPQLIQPQGLLHGHKAAVTALTFSPDGRWLASAANDHSIRLWRTVDPTARVAPAATPGTLLPETPPPLDPATGCVVVRAGRDLTVVDSKHNSASFSLRGTERQFFAGFLARNNGFLTVEMATNAVPVHLDVRRLPDGTVLTHREIFPAPRDLRSSGEPRGPFLAASPDGRWLAVPQNSVDHVLDVHVFAIDTGRFVVRLPGVRSSIIWGLRASPDSRWLVRLDHFNGDNWINIYDSQTWGPPMAIHFRSAEIDVMFATIDPASRRIATGGLGENSLRIWDLLTGRLLAHCHSGNLQWHPVWSRDSRTLVISEGGNIRFWSMIVFRELAAFAKDTHTAHFPLGFTADGRTLVTRTWEDSVTTWSPPTLAEIDLQP